MKTITLSSLMQESTQSAFTLYKKASEMLKKVPKGSVRLIGEGFYHLEEEEGRQLSFLDIFTAEKTREEKDLPYFPATESMIYWKKCGRIGDNAGYPTTSTPSGRSSAFTMAFPLIFTLFRFGRFRRTEMSVI